MASWINGFNPRKADTEVYSRTTISNAQHRQHMVQHGVCAGFTLIEAMIVVGIIAIAVALAYPTYVDQVRKARRADAESSLLAAAQILERCFTRLNAYTIDDGEGGGGCTDPTGASQDGYYQITLDEDESGATSYTLIAAPQGDQANDPCGTYRLDHLGNKTPLPDGDRCWGVSG